MSINTNLSPKSALEKAQNVLFFYFYHLDERNLSYFRYNWPKIKERDLTPKALSLILYKTALHLTCAHSEKKKNSIKFLNDNIDLWSDKFSEQNSKKSEQDWGLSLWSLAVLDSAMPSENFKTVFQKLRSNIPELKNPIHRKQVHDADLWINGKSEIENMKRSGKSSELESKVINIFEKSGLTATINKKEIIPPFQQAIDLIISDGNQEIYIEIDGPSHFVNNKARPNSIENFDANTLFRSALIQKFITNQRVIRIDYQTCIFLEKAPIEAQKKRLSRHLYSHH